MKNIIFIGDSFCCAWRNSLNPDNHYHTGQYYPVSDTLSSWMDVAADQLDLAVYSFGFPGRSWYFSRTQFLKYLSHTPDLLDNASVVVFCHTDHCRMNTSDSSISVAMQMPGYQHDSDKALALKMWMTDLVDYRYQTWAQEQWFHEINRIFAPYPDIKLIHFNNFPFSIESSKLLNGCVFTTALMHLSLAEFTGTTQEITKRAFDNDQRINHFNEHNNRALGNLVVDAVKNYRTGRFEIDISKFDYNNPKAVNWPDGKWAP